MTSAEPSALAALLPPRRLRWMHPLGVALAAIALGGSSMTACWLRLSFGPGLCEAQYTAWVLVSTLICSTAVVAWTLVIGPRLRGRSEYDPRPAPLIASCCATAVVAGMANAESCLLGVGAIAGSTSEVIGCIAFGLLPALGAVAGVVYGLLYALVLKHVDRVRRRPALDALEIVLLGAGVWLVAAGLVGVSLAGFASTALVQIGVAALGTLSVVLAAALDLRRLATLRRIYAGAHAGSELIVPTWVPTHLPAGVTDDGAALDGALALVAFPGDGAYRASRADELVVRLPSERRVALRSAKSRLAVAVIVLVTVPAATVALWMRPAKPEAPRSFVAYVVHTYYE